jgi:hypothetical protein
MEKQNRELTFGEKAVGLTFNPNGDSGVNKVKELYAEIIDIMNEFQKVEASNMNTGEHKRLASVAITEAQTAQMWAVKALTWRDQ